MAPKTKLEPSDVLCPWHGEPFQSTWPKGYGVAGVFLFEQFAKLEDVSTYAGGDPEKLDLAIAEFGPMCCAVGNDLMKKAYIKSGIGAQGKCEVCAQITKGTPYQLQEAGGIRTLHHVCFDCVLRKFEPPTGGTRDGSADL